MPLNDRITVIRSAVGSMASTGFNRFLQEGGFRVVGTDITLNSAGARLLESVYLVPPASSGYKVVEKYSEIVKNEGAKWIISGPEPEILLLAHARRKLAELGAVVFHPPVETLEIITDKLALYRYFLDKNIDIPATSTLEEADEDSGGKMVFKPRLGRGSSGVYTVEPSRLSGMKQALSGQDYLTQPFIEGPEFTVDLLCDMNGALLSAVPRKRLSTDSGICVVGETAPVQELISIVERICGDLRFYGGNCMQFILDGNGTYWLTDINPRFGGGAILSLRASSSFAGNFIALLSGQREGFQRLSMDFGSYSMYRHYEEIFEQ